MRLTIRHLAVIAAAVACLYASRGNAQEAPQPAAPPATQPIIYVPYDQSHGPQLAPGDSVLLPYSEFLRLSQAGGGTTEARQRPAAALVGADYRGTVNGSVALFQVELRVDAIAQPDQVLEFDLPFGGAIQQASVEGPQASLAPLEQAGGMRMRLVGGGGRVVRMQVAAPVTTQGTYHELQLAVPRAAAASIELRINEDVEIVDSAGSSPAIADQDLAGGSVLRASAGGRDQFKLGWRSRMSETGAATQSRLDAEQTLTVKIGSQQATAEAELQIRPLNGGVSAVELQIPAGLQVLALSGPLVKSWSEADSAGRLRVELAGETRDPIALALRLALPLPAADQPLRIPDLGVINAVQTRGVIVLDPAAELSLWPEEVIGVEVAPAPAGTALGGRAFRFATPGWQLAVSISPIKPRVRVQGLLVYELSDEQVRLRVRDRLTIDGRGIFEVALDAPEGFTVRDVGPDELVADFRQAGRRITIQFHNEQKGASRIELDLQRPRAAGEDRITLEPVAVVGADEDIGQVVLAAPPALKIGEAEARGVEAIDVRSLAGELQPLLTAEHVAVLGYRYFTPTFAAVASIERQQTRVTCDTAILASVEPALISILTTLQYNVEFSATDQFQLRVPAALGDGLRIEGADIKEKTRATPAAGDELTTWTIRLQRRVLGPYALTVAFEQPLAAADAGKPSLVQVPVVRATAVARETGAIAIARRENVEVRVTQQGDGLEPRDIKELPASLAGGFLGFRYFEPNEVSLELELVRHEVEAVLSALIRRLHIETVVSDQRRSMTEATFEIQNNREQYLELKLPEGMKILAAFVRGAPVRPSIRERDGARLIELAKSEAMDSAFRVRMILEQDLGGGKMGMRGNLSLPAIEPLNMPVLRTSWRLYLPRGYRYVNFGGTMRQESGGGTPWIEPAAEKLLNDLPAKVAGGIARGNINPPQVAGQVAYDAAESEEEKRARLQGSTLEIPIVREGLVYEFSMLSGSGDIRADYWKRKPLIVLQGLLALLLVAGLGVVTLRRGSLLPAAGVALASFLLASLCSGFWGLIFATCLAASGGLLLGAAGLTILRRLGTEWRAHSAAQRERDMALERERERDRERLRAAVRPPVMPQQQTEATDEADGPVPPASNEKNEG